MKLSKDQIEEIKNLQNQNFQTKRVTAPELEKVLYEAIPALDHGFVRVIDYMGDDTQLFNQPEFLTVKAQNKFQQIKV